MRAPRWFSFNGIERICSKDGQKTDSPGFFYLLIAKQYESANPYRGFSLPAGLSSGNRNCPDRRHIFQE